MAQQTAPERTNGRTASGAVDRAADRTAADRAADDRTADDRATDHAARTMAQFMRERWLFLFCIPCVTALLALHAMRWDWMDSIDRFGFDRYFLARGAYPPLAVAEKLPHTRDIVLVQADHPVPRRLLSRVLHQLRLAKVVAVDLMFVNNEAELGPQEKEGGWYRDDIRRWRADDVMLARAIRENGNVVLGAWPEESILKNAPQQMKGEVVAPTVSVHHFWEHPAPALWQSARYRAHLSVELEDSVARRVRLLRETTSDSGSLPCLGLAAASAALGVSPERDEEAVRRRGYLQLGERRIPTDSEGRMMIDFVGGRECFSYVSNSVDYAEVLNFYEPEDFRDKIVIVGESSLKSKDTVRTPFGETSGMEVHANIIATLLERDGPPRLLPLWATALLTFGCSLLLAALLLLRLPPWANLLFALLQVGALAVLGIWLFIQHRQLLAIGPPLLAIALTYNAVALYEYQRTRRLLSTFVGHEMFRRMLGMFSPLQLGGTVEEACAFFCDLRGFSKLAAMLPPALTTQVLNEYTNALVQVVRAYGGRPISYQGDGVFVLFEKELAGAEFAAAAVHAALDFTLHFKELQAKWEHEGVAHLEVGIGIASGSMMIGLVGSDEHMKPDAVGDPVNVAARLQGLSEETGCSILISQSVHDRIRELFPTLYCGAHVVRGRDEPLEVYAVTGSSVDGDAPSEKSDRSDWKQSLKAPYERLQELAQQELGHWNISAAPDETPEAEEETAAEPDTRAL